MTDSPSLDMSTEEICDWRGTPIAPGALVIYGAPVGRSIAMVEATVADPPFTPSGRVWLNVVRRAYGYSSSDRERVHVGADRLTVVGALPITDRPTQAESAAERKARYAEMDRVKSTHAYRPDDEFWVTHGCVVCGASRGEVYRQECPGPADG